MTRVSLIIPFDGSGNRKEQFDWLYRRWKHYLSKDVEILVGSGNRSLPFSKSAAINEAFKKSSGDVLAIVDADTWPEIESFTLAVQKVIAGDWKWAQPCKKFYRIGKQKTLEILKSEHSYNFDDIVPSMCDAVEDWTNAFFIVSRDLFVEVGGFDERFKGWGGEDQAMIRLLLKASNQFNDLSFSAYHLWHPQQNGGPKFDYQNVWDGQKNTNNNLDRDYEEFLNNKSFEKIIKANKKRNNI